MSANNTLDDPLRQLEFNLHLGIDAENDEWEDESDEFIEWLEEQIEDTDFSVAVTGPVAYRDYENTDEPLVREMQPKMLIQNNWRESTEE